MLNNVKSYKIVNIADILSDYDFIVICRIILGSIFIHSEHLYLDRLGAHIYLDNVPHLNII